MKIAFDVQHLYYLPQYLPVYQELKHRNIECVFIFYHDNEYSALYQNIVYREQLNVAWKSDIHSAVEFYQQQKPDWIIFGNNFEYLDKLDPQTHTALLYHGIGIKDCYYDKPLFDMDIRFIEGEFRRQEILRRHPSARIEVTGFAKLDPLFNHSLNNESLLQQYHLDPNKKTLLYAPTFYPSSIELFDKDWPQTFWEYNIIVKPHFFSLTRLKYQKQQKLFQHWEQYSNTYIATLEDYNLLPFMSVSDVLISEASSALFEFAAMDKPVVWCDFIKLRWSYRGPLKYRYNRRMDQTIKRYQDIAAHAGKYQQLKLIVDSEIHKPQRLHEKRKQYTEELIGKTDGKSAQRIADFLLNQ